MADHAHAANGASPTANAGMRSEIGQKWSKFTESEITALKSKEELVKQVQSKYALDTAQAQKDVDTFAKGRAL